jgi:hypothetical protein
MTSTMTNRTSAAIGEASNQAQNVAADIRRQFSEVSSKTKSELRSQADERAAQAARGLRALSSQATALAQGRTEEAGDLTSFLNRIGSETGALATRLETRKTGGLLEDMTRFGRRQPVVFLALALGAGVLAGRAVRVGAEAGSGTDEPVQAQYETPYNGLGSGMADAMDEQLGEASLPSADEVRV